jgi:hypothetical protein
MNKGWKTTILRIRYFLTKLVSSVKKIVFLQNNCDFAIYSQFYQYNI